MVKVKVDLIRVQKYNIFHHLVIPFWTKKFNVFSFGVLADQSQNKSENLLTQKSDPFSSLFFKKKRQ